MNDPIDMMDLQLSITHANGLVENGAQYTVHFLCSQFSPYPSMTLGRSAWPAVCLLFTLPSLCSCYYQEDEGRVFKITVGDEYVQQHQAVSTCSIEDHRISSSLSSSSISSSSSSSSSSTTTTSTEIMAPADKFSSIFSSMVIIYRVGTTLCDTPSSKKYQQHTQYCPSHI